MIRQRANQQLNIRLTSSQKNEILKLSAETDVSITDIILIAIREIKKIPIENIREIYSEYCE